MAEKTPSFDKLCSLLSEIFEGKYDENHEYNKARNEKLSEEIFRLADAHGISALFYPVKEGFNRGFCAAIDQKAKSCVISNIKLTYLARYIQNAFSGEGIEVFLLKGATIARFYPTAELRQFSDVDLFLPKIEDLEKARILLKDLNFTVCERQDSTHHIEYIHESGLKLELHLRVTRPFERDGVNDYINSLFETASGKGRVISVYNMEFRVLPKELEALYMLLHILQHYLNKGFGLNLLCDYRIYWNSEPDTSMRQQYISYVKDLGLSDFSDALSMLSYAYLGGSLQNYPWINKKYQDIKISDIKEDDIIKSFITEILDAGKFGANNRSRLVNVESDSATGLIGQFHHQTRQYFPRASKVFLLWPLLWAVTLCIFLRNNRLIRKQSTLSIIKTALGRGKLSKRLNLWDCDL